MTDISVLGTLADGVVGRGGGRGLVRVDGAGIEVDWWIGADDGWLVPADAGAPAIRPGIAPAIEARVRVPGGEAVLRAYAVAGSSAPVVVAELENASGGPVVVAWVVRAAPGYKIGRVALVGSTLLIDERARIELPRVPSRWAVAPRADGVRDAVVGGRAASGRFEPVATRRGDLEVAVLFPVAHRTKTRVAAAIAGGRGETGNGVVRLPSLADVERGWVAALEQGTQVELPDEQLQAEVDAGRATLLLGTAGGTRRDRVVVSAARAWGLADGSDHGRARAEARADDDPWPALRATAGAAASSPRRAAEWLAALREALVRVDRDHLDLLPHFPVEWLGLPVAVHDAPTRHGRLSFALRWHGARPALLWDAPQGSRVRVSTLDPSWESSENAGEALLGEIDVTRLLPLGTATASGPGSESRDPSAPEPGVPVDEPGSFL